MKVLKRGRQQKGWAITCHCTGEGNGGGGCGAQLLVEQGDVYMTGRSYFDGSSDTFATFTCQECGCETDVAKGVPTRVTQSKAEWMESTAKKQAAETYLNDKANEILEAIADGCEYDDLVLTKDHVFQCILSGLKTIPKA